MHRPLAIPIVVIASMALALAACGDSEPPPRSPLGVASPASPSPPTAAPSGTPPGTAVPSAATASPLASGTATAVAPGAASLGTPVPLSTATRVPAATVFPIETPSAGAGAEVAAGRAIEALAEWLGVQPTALSVLAVEAVEWSDACLGIRIPGLLCAQVITPGWQVLLLDAFDGSHTLHLDGSGNAAWAGEVVASGVVVAVDDAAGRVTLDVDGESLTLRFAPGTQWWPPGPISYSERDAVGQSVTVAYDAAPDGGQPPVAAWLADTAGDGS